MLLLGAAERPRVVLLTALPLVWGEGDAADVLNGRSKRSATLTALDGQFDIRPIDTISAATLGNDIAIIAQPRRLTPHELVALDTWVRGGGRVMIFADPELVWLSRYPLGDVRRPPPVELLDPLFAHWGVTLGDSDRGQRVAKTGGVTIVTMAAGRWTGPNTCGAPDPLVLECRVGKGHAILVGDADMLDERLWQATNGDNPAWIAAQIHSLDGSYDATRGRVALAIGTSASIALAWWFVFRHFKGT
jgi:ABC-type uncharacterized transport system